MKQLKKLYTSIINGEKKESKTTYNVVNPLTNQHLTKIAYIDKKDINLCIDTSINAFEIWKKYSVKERASYLNTLSNLIEKNESFIAKTITLEQGKPIKEALNEIKYANSFIKSAINAGLQLKGDILNTHFDTKQGHVINEPYGVIGCITPWNFPAAMVTRKIAPALITGNTVILKPSELTPITAYIIGELALMANFPPGVLSIISGNPILISDILLENQNVKKISFTGSTSVGKSLIRRSSQTITKLSLELGGHAPFIVFNDANLKLSIKGALSSKFRNGGQTCICSNRFFIQEKIYPKFLKLLVKKTSQLKLGNGLKKQY